MKICIDIQAAVAQRAGIGRYTRLLVEHLAPLAESGELVCFYFDFLRKGQPPAIPNLKRSLWFPGRIAQFCWKKLAWPPYDWFAGAFDLYHFTNFIIPPLTHGKKIVSIHDASFLRHPEFAENRNLEFLRSQIKDTIRRADAVITISHFSADEISSFFPEAENKIHVIYPGVMEHVWKGKPEERSQKAEGRDQRSEVRRQKSKIGSQSVRPYILTVGTLEPRKNIPFLIEVFEKMEKFQGKLVIAGRRGWKFLSTLERISTSNRAKDIILLEDVDDDDLAGLYVGAELFIYPSFYEGFGFPPLEAFVCGAPVISSAGGSLKEVLGNGALVMERYDSNQWAEASLEIINNREKRQSLVDAGKRQAAKYTWAEAAKQTMELYRSFAS